MKPAVYKAHRIVLSIGLLMCLPLLIDFIFDLGFFGRLGKGILLFALGLFLLYAFFFAPTRAEIEELKNRHKSITHGSPPE